MTDEKKMTVCLAYGFGTDHRCEKAYQCQRHLALRSKKFPEGAEIEKTACKTREYQLFVPEGGELKE